MVTDAIWEDPAPRPGPANPVWTYSSYRDGVRDPATHVLALVRSRPPTLGAGHLVCIDGPAGSGKTTLAAALLAGVPSAALVHMDDLYEGWSGLPHVDAQLAGLLAPLAAGQPGGYRRWDWQTDRWAEQVTVEPADLVVLEGVGSGSLVVAPHVSVIVWVEAAHDLRQQRGLARDGETFAPHWRAWARAETEHFVRHRTRERADLLVDGETGSVVVREQQP